MLVSKKTEDSKVVLLLEGRIDTEGIPVLQDSLADQSLAGYQLLELDFSRVEYINSGGLRVIIACVKERRKEQKGFRIAGTSPDVYKVFKLSGFTDIMDIAMKEAGA